MGALDVCPFIPVRDVSMVECVLCAKAFGQRLAEELNVPGECLGGSLLGHLWIPISGTCSGSLDMPLTTFQIMPSMEAHI